MRTIVPKLMDDLEVGIPIGSSELDGTLLVPEKPKGLVLFAHGSGSTHYSPRERYVAHELNQAGFATLLVELLTGEEELDDEYAGRTPSDIRVLAGRFSKATAWTHSRPALARLPVGYFGASTGAAAALSAAAARPREVKAVVSRGGHPDLAAESLYEVRAATLLIVGGEDAPLVNFNKRAIGRLAAQEKQLEIVEGATHLFEEPGTLEKVTQLTVAWFERYL